MSAVRSGIDSMLTACNVLPSHEYKKIACGGGAVK